jgi:enoyl-CoA hydratase/carnithine racemase
MSDLLYEKHDFHAVFTYNRPERLNSLGGQLLNELTEAMKDFDADPAMRVGIVTGTGRAFSAGGDLKEMAEGSFESKPQTETYPYSGNPKPFIAAINGLAVGGGMETALDCDIRICSTDAYFGLFEPKRGIMAGYATKHLSRVIGLSAANYILLTADRIEPMQALKWGIVTEVVEPEQLLPRAEEIATLIAENAPLSVEGTKAQIQEWRLTKIDEAWRLGNWVGKVIHASEDSTEGPKAFAEKREPTWQGR